MKKATKKKPAAKKVMDKKPKANSNLKATFGILKGRIIESDDCWDDLKRVDE